MTKTIDGFKHSEESKRKMSKIAKEKGFKPPLPNKTSLSYNSVHLWLRKQFGRADRCENKNCAIKHPKQFEWSKKRGKPYARIRKYYWRLCSSCHRKYDITDGARKNMSLAHTGKKHSIETKKKMSIKAKGNQRARKYIIKV